MSAERMTNKTSDYVIQKQVTNGAEEKATY